MIDDWVEPPTLRPAASASIKTKSAIPMDGAVYFAATLTTAGTYAVPVFD
jgi:hypothetical protein